MWSLYCTYVDIDDKPCMLNGSYRRDNYYRLIILIYRCTSLISVHIFAGLCWIYRVHIFNTRQLGAFILRWRATVPVPIKLDERKSDELSDSLWISREITTIWKFCLNTRCSKILEMNFPRYDKYFHSMKNFENCEQFYATKIIRRLIYHLPNY